MVNLKLITQAVESLLRDKLIGYMIERNPLRPDDPWKATVNRAWIGVYRGSTEYEGHAIGSRPWLANVSIIIEIQAASMTSVEDCEDALLDAEDEVLGVINSNRTLGGMVDMVVGYSISYEINQDSSTYFQASIITVRAQVRTA